MKSASQVVQDIVLDFTEAAKKSGNVMFHMTELTAHVAALVPIAPDTPGRILRLLKRKGYLNYRVEDRAASLYEVLP